MFKLLIFVLFLGIASSTDITDPTAKQLSEHKASLVVKEKSTLVTSFGTPVDNLRSVLTAGQRGPILLQDTNFMDNIAKFGRERIPERMAHAVGHGALGYFVVTHDITQYTKAAVFSKIGTKTQVAVRFSSVVGSLGSAETVRNTRGFAIKFYTSEGIWDLVANNAPVFITRDPMMFSSFTRAQKNNPVTNCPDADMAWDLLTLRPESIYLVMIINSDAGIPNGSRHMHGFGIHAFKLVNNDGNAVYCKFYLRTEQGLEYLTSEKARELAGLDPQYETRDLYNAIKTGNFPCWKFYIQVMTFEQANTFKWNPFDSTKIWPESEYPLIPVGKLVLNQNPSNYFADVEQIAFSPSNMPPGIEASPDKLLQGRMFSYPDTQRYRLGPNFMQIPVNKPRGMNVTNYQRDGLQAIYNQDGAVNYFPNSFSGSMESQDGKIQPYPVSGDVNRYETGDEDNFSQATMFWNGLSAEEQVRLVNNLVHSLSRAAGFLQERAIKNFCQVDTRLGEMLARGLSINVACGKA